MKLSIIFRILWRYVVGSLSLLPSSSPLYSRFTYSNTPANLPSSIFTMINMVNQLLSLLKYADIDTDDNKQTKDSCGCRSSTRTGRSRSNIGRFVTSTPSTGTVVARTLVARTLVARTSVARTLVSGTHLLD